MPQVARDDYYVEPAFPSRKDNIWISTQTLGCRINCVHPHIHPAVEILYFLVGESKVIVDGIEYFVSPGDMVLFRSNSIHHVYSMQDTPCRHFVLQITPSQILDFSSAEHASTYLLRLSLSCKNEKVFWSREECESNGLADAFKKLIALEESSDVCSDIKVKILSAEVLLTVLEEIINTESEIDEYEEAVSGCIYNAIVYVNNHYAENITADSCAKRVFMSYGHFSRSFKKATGANFKDYLNHIRVNHAEKALLGSDAPISEICRDCGFNTVSYFIAMFRRIKGLTPAAFREKFKSQGGHSEESEAVNE